MEGYRGLGGVEWGGRLGIIVAVVETVGVEQDVINVQVSCRHGEECWIEPSYDEVELNGAANDESVRKSEGVGF